MMRVLVTGAGGFVGKHLVSELKNRNYEVIAAASSSREDAAAGKLHGLDITDLAAVKAFIGRTRPDTIFHLAAQSNVMKAWHHPSAAVTVNTVGSLHLLQAIQEVCPGSRMINVGSGDEYGLAGKQGMPLSEETACQPQNPYAVSKFAAGQLVLQMAKKNNLQAIHVRAFNHFGPGQEEGFAVSDFSSQIASIEKGLLSPVIRVGDLSAQRDFTYISDIIAAYVALVETDVPNGVYNVCSSIPRMISTVLEHLVQMSDVDIRIETDVAKLRPSEVPIFVGASGLLEQVTGWKPKTVFLDGLERTLDWWRSRVGL
ncbi:GDP-mannose 4,6-dehydratase [Paenibacillus allorhizosphaerae]|uniref:GDP-6-deoxy-D-mannose reductase n=1 Tax=Paenibacillus allorhizosphaerae TaxID=2849866 RepID=A0ABM8VEU6_9BACL|nr:GDP-mannose 4,6-dehydratase [Paenibacillus allorhizosphaerae]CAG7632636.1 GDP-6-deoxy-D-mannose reductase [Paenibacillus allorhizosphaerae]